MKKHIIAFAAALLTGIFAATLADAKPVKKHHHAYVVKKHHVSKKRHRKSFVVRKRTPVRVAENKNSNSKCQFLFWEVECAKNTEVAVVKPAANTVRTSAVNNDRWNNSPSITFGLDYMSRASYMIGMSVKNNRTELSQKFATTFGQRVDPARIPWCAAWANTVLAEAGIAGTGSLMARSFVNWGKATNDPQRGDVVVLRRGRNRFAGHVGFFYGFVEQNGVKKVALLGGNQGREVRISYYPISKVIAYRTLS